jgi:YD repeat-containing protein
MKLLLLFVTAGLSAQAPVDWRLSDALGADLGEAPMGKNSARWTLRIETSGSAEERVLFDKGVEQSTREITRDAAGRALDVRELRDGEAVWDVSYHPETGLPAAETTFNDGDVAETSTLSFADGVLTRRDVKDAVGAPLFTDKLYRWPDGRLRRVERDGPAGPLAEAAWIYGSDGKLIGAWEAGEAEKAQGRHREWTFATGTSTELLLSDTQTLLTRVREAGDSGGKDTVSDAAGRVETRITDKQGRVTGEMVTVKGVLSQVRRWTYDDQGRVTEVSTESAGPPETWVYTYNPDGTVLGKLLRAGLLVKETVSRDGETQTVSLYDHGGLFLVETWSAGRLVKEAYYQNGAVVRERKP